MIAATVLFATHMDWNPQYKHIPILFMTFYLSFMMVSKVHFGSLKLIKLTGKSSFYNLVAVLCIIVIIAAEPQISLFVIGVVYSLSGPLVTLKRKFTPVEEELVEKEEDATV